MDDPLPAHVPVTLDRVETLIERRASAAEKLLFQMFAARDEALKLQAIEYERRLSLLNGEHSTLASMRAEYVLRVVYDKDMDRIRNETETARLASRQQHDAQEVAASVNRRNTLLGWMAAGIALVGWAMTLLLKFLPVP